MCSGDFIWWTIAWRRRQRWVPHQLHFMCHYSIIANTELIFYQANLFLHAGFAMGFAIHKQYHEHIANISLNKHERFYKQAVSVSNSVQRKNVYIYFFKYFVKQFLLISTRIIVIITETPTINMVYEYWLAWKRANKWGS